MSNIFETTATVLNDLEDKCDQYTKVLAVITRWMPKLPLEFVAEIRDLTREKETDE